MMKHILLAIALLFAIPAHSVEAKGEVEITQQQVEEGEVKIPAKEAHDQKGINIVLTFILIFSAICLTAVGFIIWKSEK